MKVIKIYSKKGSVKPLKEQVLRIYKGKYKNQKCIYKGAKKGRCIIEINNVKKVVYSDILGYES